MKRRPPAVPRIKTVIVRPHIRVTRQGVKVVKPHFRSKPA